MQITAENARDIDAGLHDALLGVCSALLAAHVVTRKQLVEGLERVAAMQTELERDDIRAEVCWPLRRAPIAALIETLGGSTEAEKSGKPAPKPDKRHGFVLIQMPRREKA